jgi:hypothetical protein
VTAAMAAVALVLLIFEAVYLWLGRLDHIRAEAAYWAARDHRPPLYDWAQELDL